MEGVGQGRSLIQFFFRKVRLRGMAGGLEVDESGIGESVRGYSCLLGKRR